MASKQETSTEHRTGVKPNFEQTMFTASMRDLRFTASGDVLLTMVVPYSDKHLVVPVSDAYGINLDVDIRRKRAKKCAGSRGIHIPDPPFWKEVPR